MRIAILGGSFDPIHNGHLQIAKTALKKLSLDEVWFMPTAQTPLKEKQSVSYQDRCHMVARAIHPYRKMKLCTLEGEWEDCSYTIRSVQELMKRFPMHHFSWLIGDDQALHFDKWKDSETLKQLIPFYVFTREKEAIHLPQGLQRVDMDLVEVASTQVRFGQQLHQLPSSVLDYIGTHGLYLEDMVKCCMSEKRYAHSLSVAHLCETLARVHHLDTKKAYIMGLVHDVCKELPYAKACIWMRHHMPNHMEEARAIWHGYIGASYIRQHFHIYDKQICEAVFHHVTGRNKTDYDRILYIADKLDPSRGYDVEKQIALSKQNIKKAFQVVKQEQLAYLKKEGTI